MNAFNIKCLTVDAYLAGVNITSFIGHILTSCKIFKKDTKIAKYANQAH